MDIKRPYIENLDRPENSNVGDKTVDSRTDVDVSGWVHLMDPLRNQQILMKVMSRSGPGLCASLVEAGERPPHREWRAYLAKLGHEQTAIVLVRPPVEKTPYALLDTAWRETCD